MNTIHLIGHLGADPSHRVFDSGKSVATLSLATNERWNDANGQRVERTDWHTIVCWNGLATLAQRYLTKGRQIAISGRLQYREYQSADGHNVRVAEVIAQNIQMLDRPKAQQTEAPAENQGQDYGEVAQF